MTAHSAPAGNTAEHPFAPYVRIVGKGKTGTRSLSRAEAREAFAMILRDEVEPLQLGAFLMLLRVKEETGEELAGFVEACRAHMPAAPRGLHVDLDWASYAGKKHQHPWFILSQLLLSQGGYRVCVHGADGHTSGRLYTEAAFRELGLPVATDWSNAAEQLDAQQLSYWPLRGLCPPLNALLQLKPLLGLRSPVNTLTRMLNPTAATCSIQSIFHPAYAALHQEADELLGQARSLVFKGDSGEVEIKPQADTRLQLLQDGQRSEQLLQRTMDHRVAPVSAPATEPLRALWRDELDDHYGLEATLMTCTAALMLLEPTLDAAAGRAKAETLWGQRDKGKL